MFGGNGVELIRALLVHNGEIYMSSSFSLYISHCQAVSLYASVSPPVRGN